MKRRQMVFEMTEDDLQPILKQWVDSHPHGLDMDGLHALLRKTFCEHGRLVSTTHLEAA